MEEMERKSAAEMLNPEVRKLIVGRGWNRLTEIQELSIPYIMKGFNTLIMAPTGEGKTEASMLPIVSILLESYMKPIDVLYITPMKALINDIHRRISWWAEKLGIRVSKKHGDTPARERSKRSLQVPNILITTPESLEIDLDWAPKFRKNYKNIRFVVVDEVHELLSSKRGVQLLFLLERLRELTNNDFQRIGLSATIGRPDKAIELLSGSSQRPKKAISVDVAKEYIFNVKYIDDKEDPWMDVANALISGIEAPTLVFVNSRYVAERVKHSLESAGVKDIFVHHSSVSAELREEAESKLKKGSISAIVCTKTLELGIDIGAVKKVIQIRSPGKVSNLIQRVGRSGHVVGGLSKGEILTIGPIDFAEALSETHLAKKGYIENDIVDSAPIDVVAKEIIGITLGDGPSDPGRIYNILKNSPVFTMSKERFQSLLKYMEQNGLVRLRGGLISPGNTFYKIWRFKLKGQQKAWWSRNFPEFFTTIPEKDVFVVKNGDYTIGYIDSIYVYRNLRVGDTIRLAGSSWEIRRIDVINSKIEVSKSSGYAEIPLWKGEGTRRSIEVSKAFLDVISGKITVEGNVDGKGMEALEKLRESYKNLQFGVETLIYERCDKEHVFIVPLGTGTLEALASLIINAASKIIGLNVYYRPSFYGFSIYIGDLDPLEILMNIDPKNVYENLKEAIIRSPYLYQVLREVQPHLGKIGSIDDSKDSYLIEEVSMQILKDYFDVEGAKSFIEKLKKGKITIINMNSGNATPLAKSILEVPPVRPWIQDLAVKIGRLLDNNGLTIFEIADILELAEKTIENKLKEMRKPDYDELRVVRFIDVDDEEYRWTLLSSFEDVSKSEEFINSFTPKKLREPMRVYIKVTQQSKPKEYILTPKFLIESWKSLEEMLPNEIYEVKITSAYEYGSKEDLTVSHYFVNKGALRMLLMNAARYMEIKQKRRCF
ncbi:MAG: DEAD/DEAH box helicase [Caldisphaeraceae archaeon]|nr:DEAD/DEAH box helicase [Caldisphaeraceae archaeon]MEB3692363.1 DEAD/DEAH box helicase [Caldisphaeraceae archaeon]MEB3798217.1 DEAD/DEAH box helicase [Caldisphaeraceae archaeon]